MLMASSSLLSRSALAPSLCPWPTSRDLNEPLMGLVGITGSWSSERRKLCDDLHLNGLSAEVTLKGGSDSGG